MLRNNLAVILTEQQLRISKVANDTGISRTTLTALSQNSNKMVQLETINTLCMYLRTDPATLFEFLPFNFNYYFEIGDLDKEHYEDTKHAMSVYDVSFFINVVERGDRTHTIDFAGLIEDSGQSGPYGPRSITASIHPTNKHYANEFAPYIKQLSPAFLTDITKSITALITKTIAKELLEPQESAQGISIDLSFTTTD